MKLQGCFTAIVTPFCDGEVDFDSFGNLIEDQISSGIDGIVPVGTTGECPTLNAREHSEVISFTVKAASGRCPVIAGTGANCAKEALELTRYAASVGADASLQVTPYYNKPMPEGLFRHFSTVANEGGLPIILYNVPSRTGREIDIETIERLSDNPRVIGVKEAGGSVDRVSQILSRCDLNVLSGDDSLTLPMISVGARGVISVVSNLLPGKVAGMVHAALSGNWEEALNLHRQLYPLFSAAFVETNPIPIKAALALVGRIREEYRLPLYPLQEESREVLRGAMESAGITLPGSRG